MKPISFAFITFLIMFVTGCAPPRKSQLDTTTPPLVITQPTIEVSTGQGNGQAVALPSLTPISGGITPLSIAALPADGVTLSENGMTFSMQVGESFLLNLGMDVYDWTLEVDRQDVLQRRVGVTVIRGAQGIYIAQASGIAVLTANGDPLCLQSKPPCKMPSISFRIILIVN